MSKTKYPGIPDTLPPEPAELAPSAALPTTAAAIGKVEAGIATAGAVAAALRGDEPARALPPPVFADPPAGPPAGPPATVTIATPFGAVPIDAAPSLGTPARDIHAGVDPVSQYSPSTIDAMRQERQTRPVVTGEPPRRALLVRLAEDPDGEIRNRAREALVAIERGAADAGIKARAALDTARERDRRR